jgi:carboxypeptidase C (cathepsin A)
MNGNLTPLTNFLPMTPARLVTLAVVSLLGLPLLAEEKAPTEKPGEKKPAEQKDEKAKEEKPKEEKPKVTTGKVTLGGKLMHYEAQAGTVPVLKDDGTPRANIFYVYYAAVDTDAKRLAAKDAAARPIVFCFNGGPGASAVWLHLGGLGPRRVDLSPEGLSPSTVARVVDNANSVLDAADLVFVDPVGTGVSRAAKGEDAQQFYGPREDIEAVSEFVRLFTTREQRWASPKYLLGESYGVLRVGGLVDHLQQRHKMFFEGVALMSGILSFQTLGAAIGNDLPHVVFLPGLTATAHYHKRLPPDLQSMAQDKAVAAARAFAQGEYATALLRGAALADDERARIAGQLARFTGLTVEQAQEQDLRIDPSFFREMLLRKEGKILGRFDARVLGEDGDRSSQNPDFDPSFSNIVGGFASAVNAYVRGELGYESDHPYHLLASLPWRSQKYEGRYVSTEAELNSAMVNNPRLRVLVLAAYRDLACPEDAVQYSLAHFTLPPAVRANISTQRYESGHMMYLYRPDAEKLRKDLVDFVKPAK